MGKATQRNVTVTSFASCLIGTHVYVGGTTPWHLDLGLYACSPSVPLHKDPSSPKGEKKKEKGNQRRVDKSYVFRRKK